eukprot:Skav212042  [mRNA]  locus=scaffold782:132282:134704:+ [translate_table: standard]
MRARSSFSPPAAATTAAVCAMVPIAVVQRKIPVVASNWTAVATVEVHAFVLAVVICALWSHVNAAKFKPLIAAASVPVLSLRMAWRCHA